jgi:hypothetical protein
MRIRLDLSVLKQTKWYEYALRFLFGGSITVATGLIAKRLGAAFGGLFLAFPAIFPASATLIEKHETDKKLRAGISKTVRGRQAAALDARGASLGSVGLASFAFTVGMLVMDWNAVWALLTGLAVWVVVSVLIWRFRKLADTWMVFDGRS